MILGKYESVEKKNNIKNQAIHKKQLDNDNIFTTELKLGFSLA